MTTAALVFAALLGAQPAEVVVGVRVHGNAVMSSEEIVRLAALPDDAPADAQTIAGVERRLRESGRFKAVEVLKRFASIDDPTKILLVIVVDEGPVRVEWDADSGKPPRTVRRRGPPLMFLPVLDVEDGYGVTYGASFALTDIAGARSRVLLPLTWGGTKRAAAAFEKDFERGPIDRISAGAALSRREHPFFERNDHRVRYWARAERDVVPWLRVGGTLGAERVSFMDRRDRLVQAGADVIVDTRTDPWLARNAVYARAAWDRFGVRGAAAVRKRELEAAGYLGLPGQGVLVARMLHASADRALPPYLQPILGGMANLRGFAAGTAVDDTLAAGSLELRVPLTSPLSVGKVGVSAFVDAAAVYDHDARLADQRFHRGVGGSVWFTAAFLRASVAVARGFGGSTRVHFGTNVTF
jgi:outer membrane protein assembly factor BamA